MRFVYTILFLSFIFVKTISHANHHNHHISDYDLDDNLQYFAELFTVNEAFIQGSIPGLKVSSGYMTINNISDKVLIFTGASISAAAYTEFHSMAVIDDNMIMRKIDEIVINPGESFFLKPGGYHLMFMDLQEDLTAGDSVTLELTRNNGDIFTIIMPVIARY